MTASSASTGTLAVSRALGDEVGEVGDAVVPTAMAAPATGSLQLTGRPDASAGDRSRLHAPSCAARRRVRTGAAGIQLTVLPSSPDPSGASRHQLEAAVVGGDELVRLPRRRACHRRGALRIPARARRDQGNCTDERRRQLPIVGLRRRCTGRRGQCDGGQYVRSGTCPGRR
jgi:hypothetical protein